MSQLVQRQSGICVASVLRWPSHQLWHTGIGATAFAHGRAAVKDCPAAPSVWSALGDKPLRTLCSDTQVSRARRMGDTKLLAKWHKRHLNFQALEYRRSSVTNPFFCARKGEPQRTETLPPPLAVRPHQRHARLSGVRGVGPPWATVEGGVPHPGVMVMAPHRAQASPMLSFYPSWPCRLHDHSCALGRADDAAHRPPPPRAPGGKTAAIPSRRRATAARPRCAQAWCWAHGCDPRPLPACP